MAERAPRGGRKTTHWDGCWHSFDHHQCAIAKIDELLEGIARLGAENKLLRDENTALRAELATHIVLAGGRSRGK